MRRSVLLMAAVIVAACDSPKRWLDAGSGPLDASSELDGGPGDAGNRDAGLVRLELEFDRSDAGQIIVELRASNALGPLPSLSIAISAGDAGASTALDLGDGGYRALVTPPFASGELPITATANGTSVSRTAVVLPFIDPRWKQPELVPGLVNTDGTEDSPTISPDGEWLIVGTYSPTDLLCCLGLCGEVADGRSAFCQTALGPYSAPARPDLPGANRVTSPSHIRQVAPSICLDNPDGGEVVLPLSDGGTAVIMNPPVAAYGFKRQPDGTFTQPFAIAYDNDGFIQAPFCFSFLNTPHEGQQAELVYGYGRYQRDPVNRPFLVSLPLGAKVNLGTWACDAGVAVLTGELATPLPVGPRSQPAGNTSYSSGFLFSDDETPGRPAITLVSKVIGPLSNGVFSPWAPLPLPAPGDDHRQPVVDQGRIFFARNFTISSVAWAGDPTSTGSFGAPSLELGPEALTTSVHDSRPGQIFSLGQPTFAHRPDGSTELYFVYYRTTASGTDGQIARITTRQ